MSKEIYISTTPHETRLAIVEDEQLAEVYYERENEYTLAGSIYNGKVTRVLPGMQSSFVDIGLERDAFLYVTDFMEEAGDSADFESDGSGSRRTQPAREPVATEAAREEVRREEGGREGRREDGRRGRGGRDRGERGGGERGGREQARPVAAESAETPIFDEPVAPRPVEPSAVADVSGDETTDEQGSRRWRGRRGRRRGRGGREGGSPQLQVDGATEAAAEPEETFEAEPERLSLEGAAAEPESGFGEPIEIDLQAEPRAPQGDAERSGRAARRTARRRPGRQPPWRTRPGRPWTWGPARECTRDVRSAPEELPAAFAMDDEPAAEAIVLPGESIRKYRDPAEVAAEDEVRRASAPAFTQTVVAAPPIEIVGWDGGATLPGETLSRHRSRDRGRPEVQTPRRDGRRDRAREERVPERAEPVSRSASLQPVDLQAYALAPVSAEPAFVQEPAHLEENVAPTSHRRRGGHCRGGCPGGNGRPDAAPRACG